MKKTVDVIVVFIFIISVVSIFFLREGVTLNGPTAQVVGQQEAQQKTFSAESTLFPNTQYDLRYCITNSDGTLTVGLVEKNSKYDLIEKYTIADEYDRIKNVDIVYSCEDGKVLKKLVQRT